MKTGRNAGRRRGSLRGNTIPSGGFYARRIEAACFSEKWAALFSVCWTEDAGLLLWVHQGFGEPNKIYVLVPRNAQKQDCGKDAEPV